MALAHSEYLPAGSSPVSSFEPDAPLVSAPLIRPLRDYVLVLRDPPEDQIGRIVVPDIAKRFRTTVATVRAVGPGRHGKHGRIPAPCDVGDRVIVDKWAGDVVGAEDGKHLVMFNAGDVLAVMES